MQTIKITITSSNPSSIVFKECKPKEKDVFRKLGVILKSFNNKKEVFKSE